MDFSNEFSHTPNRARNVYNRVSDWLAGSYGRDISLASSTVLRRDVFCQCRTASAFSGGI